MQLKGLGSGNLEKQYLERKRLLPLDDLTIQEKIKFKEHSTAQLKKNRKISIQRLARRERRDIQFGRKTPEIPTEFDEENFNKDNSENYENNYETKDESKKIEKPSQRPEKKNEKMKVEKPKNSQEENIVENSKKSKSFSKIVNENDSTKIKSKKEIRYSESFREKVKYKTEYSKTTNYSMDIKKSKLSTQKPYVHYKDDMSYNDKNEKKVNPNRPKTKYGKIVGSKINVKRVNSDRNKKENDRNDQYNSSTYNESISKNEVDIDRVRSSKTTFDTDRSSGNAYSSNDENSSNRSLSRDTVERIKKEEPLSETRTYPVSTGRSLGKRTLLGRKSPFTRQPLKKR